MTINPPQTPPPAIEADHSANAAADPSANAPLKVLLIEDSLPDAELEIRQLKKAGFEVSADVTDTRDGFIKLVRSKPYDVILADYALPQWTGIEALHVLRKEGLEIPFILVTGAVGDEVAADCMKRGIADYVLKNRLLRLPTAVRMAMEEKTLREQAKRDQEALRASEVRYRRLFEASQNGILVLDPDIGPVIEANPAALALLETSLTEVIGRRLWNIGPLHLAGATRETFAQATRAELTVPLKSGLLSDIEFDLSTYHAGEREMTQCSLRDVTFRRRAELEAKAITQLLGEQVAERTGQLEELNHELEDEIQERRRAEEELERLHHETELTLNSAGDGIFRVDLEGKCTFANPAAGKLLGFAADEFAGKDLRLLNAHSLPTGSPCPQDQSGISIALSQGTPAPIVDQVMHRKDGEAIPVEGIATPIVVRGEITGAVIVLRDVSHQRAMEKMKDEFVSMVSHELRTPLTAIRATLGLLAKEESRGSLTRTHRMLEIASRNTERLTRLLNDILDCARWEDQQTPIARKLCEGSDLADQAADVMRPMADTVGVVLEMAARPCSLFVDPDAILQALTNLLSNAIKFSPAGSSVRLECSRENDNVLFRVIDQGPGIPADRLESIFGRFQQVDASDSRRKGGTGLGLYLCRSIVERHGGRVWAESQVGQGSTFTVTVPIEHPFC
jgi:PAS domain S-box-containing protein